MFRATHAIVSLLACTAIGVLSAACSDDEKATPQVIFEGNVLNTTGKECNDSGDLFAVGDFGNPAVSKGSVAVKDGEASGQGTASVSCSVVPSGTDEFSVDATVTVSAATGGLFTVRGKFKTTGDQTGINIIASPSPSRSANRYGQSDGGCIVRYPEPNMGVAAGRVWGEIECPNALNISSNDGRACLIKAQFRFENCGQ